MMRDVKQGLEKATAVPKTALGEPGAASGWVRAVLLTERWLATDERVDTLLEGLAASLAGQARARAQQLFYGVVPWSARLAAPLAGLMSPPPPPNARAVLPLAALSVL